MTTNERKYYEAHAELLGQRIAELEAALICMVLEASKEHVSCTATLNAAKCLQKGKPYSYQTRLKYKELNGQDIPEI